MHIYYHSVSFDKATKMPCGDFCKESYILKLVSGQEIEAQFGRLELVEES